MMTTCAYYTVGKTIYLCCGAQPDGYVCSFMLNSVAEFAHASRQPSHQPTLMRLMCASRRFVLCLTGSVPILLSALDALARAPCMTACLYFSRPSHVFSQFHRAYILCGSGMLCFASGASEVLFVRLKCCLFVLSRSDVDIDSNYYID